MSPSTLAPRHEHLEVADAEPAPVDEALAASEDSELRVASALMQQAPAEPTAAMLLAELQRSRTQCDAWQRHAERLAEMLTVERWARGGRVRPSPEEEEAARAVLEQRQPALKGRQQPRATADASPAARREAALAAALAAAAPPPSAPAGAAADGTAADAPGAVPPAAAQTAAALVARGSAEGWLLEPSGFELGAVLRSGPLGETRAARWHGAEVTVKHVRVAARVGLANFLREVECLSGLRHPGVVPFLGAVLQGGGSYWLVSEHMPGGSLAERLQRHRAADDAGRTQWPLSERLQSGLEVASALAALEACDPPILHRDVKPSNVLIDGAGRARLADFGLSRRRPADGETEGVLTGETGTYLYMSPEIMRHELYDSKADVWSYGVMLTELITGQPPYHHTSMTPVQIALAVSAGRLRPALPDYMPRDLAALVDACCDHDPAARPGFAAVVRDLKAALIAVREREEKAEQQAMRRQPPRRDSSLLRRLLPGRVSGDP